MTRRAGRGPFSNARAQTAGGAAKSAHAHRRARGPHEEEASRPAPYPQAPEVAADRALLHSWLALIALALLRAALAFSHDMWLWGASTMRFVAPGWAWGPWAVAALLLVPALGRRAQRAFDRAGDGLAANPLAAAEVAAVALAGLVLAFPDLFYFVGDFTIRLGLARGGMLSSSVFPQAMPLDLDLHYTFPAGVNGALGVDPNVTERALGALKAGALAALAVAYARALRLRGGAAIAVAAIVVFGGWLGLFTGYGKSLGELVVITACVAVFGVTVALEGRGLLALGASLALGMLLHRSALLLYAPAAVAALVWHGRVGRTGGWKDWRPWLAFALPLLAFAFSVPRLLVAYATVDREHLAPSGAGGVLAATFAPLHLLAALNQVALLAPLALLLVALVPPLFAHARSRPDAWVIGTLALVSGLTLLLVHPRQGELRDWDVFASSALGLSFAAAWLVGEALRAAPRHAWLAPALACAALAPSVTWLAHGRDVPRGTARLHAYLEEAPPRAESERAGIWSWLGLRAEKSRDLDAAAEAYGKAAALAPSPRFLVQWGTAEAGRGHMREAQAILRRAVLRDTTDAMSWLALSSVSAEVGSYAEAHRAAEIALLLMPGDPTALRLMHEIESVAPASAGRVR